MWRIIFSFCVSKSSQSKELDENSSLRFSDSWPLPEAKVCINTWLWASCQSTLQVKEASSTAKLILINISTKSYQFNSISVSKMTSSVSIHLNFVYWFSIDRLISFFFLQRKLVLEYLVRSNIYDNYFASIRSLDRGGYGGYYRGGYGGYYGGYYGYY